MALETVEDQLADLNDAYIVAMAKLALAEAALEELSCLGNGNRPGNSDGNVIAQNALKRIDECGMTRR